MDNLIAISGTVILRIKETTLNRTESGLFKDTTFNKHAKVAISGEIVSASDKGSDMAMFELLTGDPRSTTVDPVFRRNKDYPHRIKKGDLVYFHYLTLEDPFNYITFDGEWKYYKVGIDSVFLSMKLSKEKTDYFTKGIFYKPLMHNEIVLGQPYWGEGWVPVEVAGQTIAGKMNAFGMTTETKKEPLLDHAIITDIGRGIDPYSRWNEVVAGDRAILSKGCNFVNEFFSTERWVFKHRDILGVIRKGKIVPVGDYVLIKLKEREYKGNLKVDTKKLDLRNEGEILSSGALVDEDVFVEGAEVTFASKGKRIVLDDTHALVRECNIQTITSYAI